MRRGFTLLEMLVVLGLLVAMSVAAFPVSRWAILNMRASQAAATAGSRLDNALQALRQDIWQAQKLDGSAPQKLVLTCADGRQITWQWNTNFLQRDEPLSGTRHWAGFTGGITCKLDGSIITMIIPDTPQCRGGNVCFVSQVMLYQGGRR